MLADEVDPLEVAAADDAIPAHQALPGPKVIVLYRDRGIPWLLVPPLLLLAAVGGVVAYRGTMLQRQGHAERRASLVAELARTESAPGSTSPGPAPALLAPPSEPARVATPPLPVAGPPPGPSNADERVVAAANPVVSVTVPPPRAGSSPDVPTPAPSVPVPAIVGEKQTVPIPNKPADDPPLPPPAEQTRRGTVGFAREPAAPEAGPMPPSEPDRPTSPFETPAPDPTPAPNPTAAEMDAELRRESDRISLERRRLAAAKPDLLNGDPRERISQARRGVEETRRPFHKDLRRYLTDFGREAGPEIERLCNRHGKDMLPELLRGMNRDLIGPSSRLTTRARVLRMRHWGAPESIILEDLFLQEQLNRSSRGGPKTDGEAWVFASRILLSIPPTERPAPSQTATGR